MTNFTQRDIRNYRSYEMVRTSGLYNMMSSQARLASCLDKEDYLFVQQNYSELQNASDQAYAEEALLKATDHS